MKHELQHSEQLERYFAARREEAPLVSTGEIEKLLARHDMLQTTTRTVPKKGNFFTRRRTIMTLSSIAALAVVSYVAFLTTGTAPQNAVKPLKTQKESFVPRTTPDDSTTQSTIITKKTARASFKPGDTRGPWSAPGDQIYADLTPQELAQLGIAVRNDTIFTYKFDEKGHILAMPLTRRSISSGDIVSTLPSAVHAHHFYPVLMTFSNGHGAAYHIEHDGHVEIGYFMKDEEKVFREWLQKPATPGYAALGFLKLFRNDSNGVRTDIVTLVIGKDLPQPALIPFQPAHIEGYSDSVNQLLTKLAHYYDGMAPNPHLSLPATLMVKVDTETAQDLLHQMDEEQNTEGMKRIHSIMDHLNDLVPVIVRMKPGSGAPDSSDFIFWYEPSDELFQALPQAQASAFREKLAEPPHCLTAPNGVLTSAEITYCVDRPQTVRITIHDLTGKQRIYRDEKAVAGDNVSTFSTEELPSGMYLVTVRDADGNERTRRIWVENANPKNPLWLMDVPSDSQHSVVQYTTFDDDSEIGRGILNLTHLELSMQALATLGIKNEDSAASFFRAMIRPGDVEEMTISRNDGVHMKFVKQNSVNGFTTPHFQPLCVTDGIGRKRVYNNDSIFIPSLENSTIHLQHIRSIDSQLEKIDQLIPILLRTDHSNDSVGSRDLIFWYKPTPEFLAALPDSVRAVVEQMINSTSNRPASVAEVHGAIEEAQVYPNPSPGRFSLRLHTSEVRELTITLRNLLGQQAAPPVQARFDGISEEPLDFSSVAEGVYLLDITSDAGERYIQRVVIAR